MSVPSELKQHIAKKKVREEVKASMISIIDATNTMGMESEVAEGMLEALVSSHPTLSQCFLKSLKEMSDKYVAEGYNPDMRMEAGKELLTHISEFKGHIPYV